MTPEELIREDWKKHRDEISTAGYENCAFVKIPRTGTQSINMILRQKMGHRTAVEWRHRYKKKWEDAFKFTIVRHPFTRFVSAWHHCDHIRADYHGVDYGDSIIDINEFVRQMIIPRPLRIVFKPQYLYVYDGDELLVDKVYKFEQLDEAWEDIKEKVGIDKDTKLPHLHQTLGKKDELNRLSKKILAECYKVDFERFNYAI